MVKVKATVGMYKAKSCCNTHCAGEVITIEEYDGIAKDREEKIKLDEQGFSDYLDDNYTTNEVFAMTEADKQNVQKDFEKHCRECAWEALSDEWEYIEIRTEVVISDKDFADITSKKAKEKCPCSCNQ